MTFKIVFTAYIEDCTSIPCDALAEMPHAIADVVKDKMGKECEIYTGPAGVLSEDEQKWYDKVRR